MCLLLRHNRTCRHAGRALTLAEAVISMAVVGVMLVAALNTVGASRVTQRKMGERSRGMLLAQDLMSEILRQHYEDPDLGPGSFGVGGDEVGDGSRALWEDVDDYDGWSASPPQHKDGTKFSDLEGWRRSVSVSWVDPANLSNDSVGDTGVKRIAVTVMHGDVVTASLTAIRTSAWPGVNGMVHGGTSTGGGAGSANNPPTAVASANPQTGPAPLMVMFNGTGSSDPDPGDTLTYSWDFGDGDTGEGMITTHTYMKSGTFTATLTVSDGRGGTDTDTAEIKAW